MTTDLEANRAKPPIVRRALAGVVLVVIAALAIKIVIGLVMSVFWIVIGVAAVLAVLWAINTLA
ncbi:MAG TPA: hypothetical protein VGI87_12615 [Solirubrobacteraceae bacterium]|jgi:hypothetical protein